MRGALPLLLPALALLPLLLDAKSILPKKIKSASSDKLYHLHQDFPQQLCGAIVHEMYIELTDHAFHEVSGEDDIFETAGLAVCLGIMQNYTMMPDDNNKHYLQKAPEDMDEQDKEGYLLHDIEGTLVLKKLCEIMTEDTQFMVSEAMFKRSLTETPDQIAADFCPSLVRPKKKDKAFKPKTLTEGDDMVMKGNMRVPRNQEAFDKIMGEKDQGGVLQDMMEVELHHPERLMPEEAQEVLLQAKEGCRCQVCKQAVQEAFKQVQELRKLPKFKDRWQRDALVGDIVTKLCHGHREYERVQRGYYPSVPGNPPAWDKEIGIKRVKRDDKNAEKYPSGFRLYRYKGDVDAGAIGKAADAMEMDPQTYGVFKTALVTHVCRSVIDERQADEDLAEMIMDALDDKPSKVFREYCSAECKTDTKVRKGHWHEEL
mmetsp:Transcript_45638/g.114414  ORF Transcript_45638/g.114414 Transcript_45638/m.114414 type:complete len:429 (-) Transcript_45638:134-1420(-)